MPFHLIQRQLARGTICKTDPRPEVMVMCSDRIPTGQPSPLFVSVQWPSGSGDVTIAFRRRSETGGADVRFDEAARPAERRFTGNVRMLLSIRSDTATAGGQDDVVLEIKIGTSVAASLPMSVGDVTTVVEIRAENGTDPAPPFIILDARAAFTAVPVPAAAGTFRWASTDPALEILGGEQAASVRVRARPAVADRALCALFTSSAGRSVMAVHRLQPWAVANPEARGPFPVGELSYNEPAFVIPGGLEGWPLDMTVTMQALVRYPATAAGPNQPVAPQQPAYPLVVLAHGRHAAIEVERRLGTGDPAVDGERRLDGAGDPIPLRDGAGRLLEMLNFEGLEYLAAHLASHGFIAVSINLNGRFNNVTGRGEMVEPQGTLVSCRPFELEDVAIAHRGLTILRHIRELRRRNTTDPVLTGHIDLNRIVVLGHSRGGEAAVSAWAINNDPVQVPLADRERILGIVAIAPTDNRHIVATVPYLTVIGSIDDDVSDVSGVRIFDRASPPKQLVWVEGAIHNFFSSNWYWQDEVAALPPVSRAQHQAIACGYTLVFLQRYIVGGVAGLDGYFTGERRLAGAAGVEIKHAYRADGGLVVDHYEDTPANRLANTLAETVTAADVRAFDELHIHPYVTAGATCAAGVPNWFQDTRGLMLEWDDTDAVYATALGGRSAQAFDVLAFRIGQDRTVNPPGAAQDLRVRLTDTGGRDATLRVRDFGGVPAPNGKCLLTTVRLPLDRFKAANRNLELGSLRSLTFLFSETPRGRVAIDDIEFSR